VNQDCFTYIQSLSALRVDFPHDTYTFGGDPRLLMFVVVWVEWGLELCGWAVTLSSMTWARVVGEPTGRLLELSTYWAIAKAWSAVIVAEMYMVAVLTCCMPVPLA
jgi:hypothetical protein